MPATWLNVAEKPSVAKEIASVLSNGACKTTNSLSRFNPVFEFDFEGKKMLCTSVAGHLMNDEFPPHTKSWTSFPIHGLFTAAITKHVKPELEPVKRNLESLARRATMLVLWMDCDREGENICFEVMRVVQSTNSRMDVCRAHFSALTKRDLFGAMRSLKAPNRALSDAVEARQEIDLRVGAAFSRFQTIKFRDSFSGMPRVLSFGPCQIPTLGFVVRRHWERQGFVPEDYFALLLRHGPTVFHSSRGSVFDQIAATLVFEAMADAAGEAQAQAEVTDVSQRPTRRRPPVPLATVVLQKLAATHLRISSEKCMSWAESLYQEGYISYPRTETDAFSFTDDELLELVAVQRGTEAVAAFADAMLADRANRFRRPLSGGHDDKAHPPIHPTKALRAADERGALYELIVRHFLACLSPDAVAATTAVTAEFGGERFTTSGTAILERGWLEVYPYERWHSTSIPAYRVGERFAPTDVCLERHRTAPPPNLTEANLIALMDEHGIGTDATIAQHIKTVLDREYVRREGTVFVPTALGVALASAYEVIGLSSLLHPQLRAQMELAMGDIASGKATKEQVVSASIRLYQDVFGRLTASAAAVFDELSRHLNNPLHNNNNNSSHNNSDTNNNNNNNNNNNSDNGNGAPGVTVRVAQRGVVVCGSCGGLMDLIEQRDGDRDVWHARCDRCARQHRVPSGRHNRLEPHGQCCALCGFGVLTVRNAEKQTQYTVCPRCFTAPPPGALADLEATAEFRCFQCAADCPLAKGHESVAIAPCAACAANDVRLRTPGPSAFLACRGFPACAYSVTLPRARRVRPVPAMRCASCRAVMLQFEFGGMQSVPGMDEGECVCVFCDARLWDYITVRGGARRDERGAMPQQSTEAAPYVLPTVTSARRQPQQQQRRQQQQQQNGENTASCECGVPAKQLVSRKEASRGKRFLTCSNRKCSFFQWVD